jgi:hypothetical protein
MFATNVGIGMAIAIDGTPEQKAKYRRAWLRAT